MNTTTTNNDDDGKNHCGPSSGLSKDLQLQRDCDVSQQVRARLECNNYNVGMIDVAMIMY